MSIFEDIPGLLDTELEHHTPMLLYEGPIAGLSFHIEYNDSIWDEIDADTRLVLVREATNKYDSNAVAIALEDDYDDNPEDFDFGYILGYIPKSCNADIANIIDEGKEKELTIEITEFKAFGRINNRIRIAVYRY